MSILLLYLRIFPITLFRRFDFLCIAFLTISLLVTTPMVIWQCKPFRAAWDYNIDNPRCQDRKDSLRQRLPKHHHRSVNSNPPPPSPPNPPRLPEKENRPYLRLQC
ncbi:hypothetical protein NYO67_4095 [Aspergillus flavus]|nr:hypothetical protein NYO67_4095 [Aspergillus flavus]